MRIGRAYDDWKLKFDDVIIVKTLIMESFNDRCRQIDGIRKGKLPGVGRGNDLGLNETHVLHSIQSKLVDEVDTEKV